MNYKEVTDKVEKSILIPDRVVGLFTAIIEEANINGIDDFGVFSISSDSELYLFQQRPNDIFNYLVFFIPHNLSQVIRGEVGQRQRHRYSGEKLYCDNFEYTMDEIFQAIKSFSQGNLVFPEIEFVSHDLMMLVLDKDKF